MTSASRIVLVVGAMALALSGCGRDQLAGPPTIRLGRDLCAECGMIINEDRCSAAFIAEQDGTREYVLFDDVGCMLDYQADHAADVRFVEGFIHDHSARAWGSFETATFLTTDRAKLVTPMGTGIAAFADRASAERAQGQFGGEVMDRQALAESRKAWKQAMYGKPR